MAINIFPSRISLLRSRLLQIHPPHTARAITCSHAWPCLSLLKAAQPGTPKPSLSSWTPSSAIFYLIPVRASPGCCTMLGPHYSRSSVPLLLLGPIKGIYSPLPLLPQLASSYSFPKAQDVSHVFKTAFPVLLSG